jgi:hypothetical protein
MTWTAAYGHERCPSCSHVFDADEPMALLTAKQLRRCRQCVSGATVDWDAVHAAIEQRRAQRTGEPVVSVGRDFSSALPGSLNDALKRFGIKGVRKSNVKPFSAVANDPAVVRTSERDE